MTLAAYDEPAVFAKSATCSFPFANDGRLHHTCIRSDGLDWCKDASGALTLCFELDAFLLGDGGRDNVLADSAVTYEDEIDLGALLVADLALLHGN